MLLEDIAKEGESCCRKAPAMPEKEPGHSHWVLRPSSYPSCSQDLERLCTLCCPLLAGTLPSRPSSSRAPVGYSQQSEVTGGPGSSWAWSWPPSQSPRGRLTSPQPAYLWPLSTRPLSGSGITAYRLTLTALGLESEGPGEAPLCDQDPVAVTLLLFPHLHTEPALSRFR